MWIRDFLVNRIWIHNLYDPFFSMVGSGFFVIFSQTSSLDLLQAWNWILIFSMVGSGFTLLDPYFFSSESDPDLNPNLKKKKGLKNIFLTLYLHCTFKSPPFGTIYLKRVKINTTKCEEFGPSSYVKNCRYIVVDNQTFLIKAIVFNKQKKKAIKSLRIRCHTVYPRSLDPFYTVTLQDFLDIHTIIT